MKKIEWERLEQNQAGYLYRAKVPGGWLVKEVEDVMTNAPGHEQLQNGYEWRSALCFVPDPCYVWLSPVDHNVIMATMDELSKPVIVMKP